LKLNSKRLSLAEIFPTLYGHGVPWVHPARDLNVFHDTPLYGIELTRNNGTINLNVEDLIVYRELAVKNIVAKLDVVDSLLNMDARAKFAGGDVHVAAKIAADDAGRLSVAAAGLGQRVYVGEIMDAVRERGYISELPANFEFYLQGGGRDLSELVSNTTGPIYVYSVAPGYAHAELVSYMYGGDFLTDLRHGITDLFSTNKKYNQMTISCAAINVKVRNGRIDTENGVALESNAINLRMTGNVDFGAEKLKASLITVPVRGIKLSLTGNVMNAMEFSGNLAEPDIKLNGTAVAGKVASATGIGLLLAPFTGGIGLVAGAGVGWLAGDLLENWLADDHPCRTAMTRGAPIMRDDPEWLGRPMAELVSSLVKE
jgi:hypothetical protein